MLGAICNVSDDNSDKLCWENLNLQYCLIFTSFNNILVESSWSAVLFHRKNGLLGRPKANMP